MRIRVKVDFAGVHGEIVHAGEEVDLADEAEAYRRIHAGLAEPPLRLRTAIDCIVGLANVPAGDLVDVPFDMLGPAEDGRFEPLAAVVVGDAPAEGFDGRDNWCFAPGSLVAVPPALALQLVAAGGRYATREEAAALDLGGAHRRARPEPREPEGPATRLFFPIGGLLPDGRVVLNDSYADVADADVDRLVAKRGAQRCVRARVLRDGVIVGNRIHSLGELVEVAPEIADDGDRFKAVDPDARKAEKAADVDVLAMVGEGPAEAAEPVGRAGKPAGKRLATLPGDAR